MKGHLTDQVILNKGQLMEFISCICENHKLINYMGCDDISYNLGAKDAIDGVREEICREILELKMVFL